MESVLPHNHQARISWQTRYKGAEFLKPTRNLEEDSLGYKDLRRDKSHYDLASSYDIITAAIYKTTTAFALMSDLKPLLKCHSGNILLHRVGGRK